MHRQPFEKRIRIMNIFGKNCKVSVLILKLMLIVMKTTRSEITRITNLLLLLQYA